MDELLTPVTVRRTGASFLQEVSSTTSNEKSVQGTSTRKASAPVSAEEALEILRNEPAYDSLVAVLKWLGREKSQQGAFNVAKPSPIGSQIVQVLVTDIAPNYWSLFQEDASDGKTRKNASSALQLFLDCVRSIPGINAALLRLRALTQEAKTEKKDVKRPDLVSNVKITLDLLEDILKSSDSIRRIWTESSVGSESPARRRPLEQEFVTLLGSGRVVSWAAEADEIVRAAMDIKRGDGSRWITDGAGYSRWLGRNVASWVAYPAAPDDAKLCSQLLGKSLRLGYTDAIVKVLIDDPDLKEYGKPDSIGRLLDDMSTLDQRKVIFSLLKYFSDTHLNKLGKCESAHSGEIIAGAITFIGDVVGNKEGKIDHLVSWLTSSSGAGLGDGVGIRRAVMAVVAQNRDALISVLEKTIAQFGDALYVKHSPMLQQEAHTQVLLLCAGYVHRLAPTKLVMMTRYGPWLNAISNRLAASQERARFLGMVVGEAITGLYEKGDKKLDFHQEETKGEEGMWYKGLTTVEDKRGPVEALRKKETVREVRPKPVPQPKPQHKGPIRAPAQGFIIEEVDDDESEEDDLVAYAKPDSDEEDSDDDATLVQRNKPKAPVYIRDLIRYLRDSDNYDHQKLALTTAPSLIRRKGNFGTEVKEHADELASLLIGLQDKFEIDDFYQLRLQGMIALVVTQPEVMGQWFAKTFFDGDYSASQRAAVLAVLGIGARELAGFDTSEYKEASSFPSKALPEKIERLYIGSQSSKNHFSSSSSLKPLPPNALDTVAQSLTRSFLAPMAAEAADKATGPDVLKLSTFTSRLEQQQNSSDPPNVKRKPASKPRIRAIPNTTAQILYTSFFAPLAARFQAALRSSSSRTRAIVISQPHLLATYLRTLGIVAHAAGPGTLALPAMTAELWGLLLRARGASGGDVGVVRAVLFALLALLEVNEGRMRDICAEMGSEVVETMEWVGAVFDGTRGDDGGKGEEGEVKMLAAAVLIRLREGVEKYRALLVGDMIGV